MYTPRQIGRFHTKDINTPLSHRCASLESAPVEETMKRAASHAMNDSNGDAAKNDDRGDRKRPRLPSTAVRATEDARWLLPPPGQRIPATTGGDMFPYARAARLPRNAAQDSDLLQELLLRYGGPTQPRLSTTLAPTDLLSSATSLTDPFYHRALSATTPNLSGTYRVVGVFLQIS